MNRSISHSDKLRALLVVSLCLLVFSLALSAKLSVYRNAGGACDPLSNTKLCLSGAKMDMQLAVAPLLVLWLVALTLVAGFSSRKIAAAPAPVSHSPQLFSYKSDHFPRPPPANFCDPVLIPFSS